MVLMLLMRLDMNLSNWLQSHGGKDRFREELRCDGPHHHPIWTAYHYSTSIIFSLDVISLIGSRLQLMTSFTDQDLGLPRG
jgi:hypothetical protein